MADEIKSVKYRHTNHFIHSPSFELIKDSYRTILLSLDLCYSNKFRNKIREFIIES